MEWHMGGSINKSAGRRENVWLVLRLPSSLVSLHLDGENWQGLRWTLGLRCSVPVSGRALESIRRF